MMWLILTVVCVLLLTALPEEKRTLLALSLEARLTSAEIGEIVGKRAGAVRVELHRLITQLRVQYQRLTGDV
ncbi:MAG: sigma factor-like helix-turn-helix DNA-binding protein [Chloroflexota bacterium]